MNIEIRRFQTRKFSITEFNKPNVVYIYQTFIKLHNAYIYVTIFLFNNIFHF